MRSWLASKEIFFSLSSVRSPDKILNMSNEALNELRLIEAKSPENWWFYPPEDETHVQGFHGTGRIFIVGVRPSMDEWPKTHKNRRALYDLLCNEGATDCHLTDFFKRRGQGNAKDLRKTIPLEFDLGLPRKNGRQEFRNTLVNCLGIRSQWANGSRASCASGGGCKTLL